MGEVSWGSEQGGIDGREGELTGLPDRFDGGSEEERGKRQSNFEVSRPGIRHLLMPLIEAKVVNIGY